MRNSLFVLCIIFYSSLSSVPSIKQNHLKNNILQNLNAFILELCKISHTTTLAPLLINHGCYLRCLNGTWSNRFRIPPGAGLSGYCGSFSIMGVIAGGVGVGIPRHSSCLRLARAVSTYIKLKTSWISSSVHRRTQKIICQGTARATKNLKLRTKKSRRGGFRSSGSSFGYVSVWSASAKIASPGVFGPRMST